MWNLKYDTNELVSEENQTQTNRTDLRLPRGRWGPGRNGQGVWG